MIPDFPWRQCVALFLALLVCTALWAQAGQERLAEHMIRLHVLANSDDREDQALKLQVRDRILRETRVLLADRRTAEDAAEILSDNLDRLAESAQRELRDRGCDCPVQVTLEETWFPTRIYGSTALPAGTYQALRVVIGEGKGHNWWCVVFPSLCLPAVSETSLEAAGFTEGEISLITDPDQPLRIRFKTLEYWGLLKHALEESFR